MKIRYRRTGGIANIKKEVEFDSDSLPAKHQGTLKNLLAEKSLETSTHSDDFIYELEVIDGTTRVKRRFVDSQCSADDLSLFDYLTQKHKDTKKH